MKNEKGENERTKIVEMIINNVCSFIHIIKTIPSVSWLWS